MGALVTLELPGDSPVRELPWIITFGPLTDIEDWEPVVCGPYELRHALALAEDVVADEDLMAVVEPVMAFFAPDEIRAEISAAKASGVQAARAAAADRADLDEIAEEAAAYPENYHLNSGSEDEAHVPGPLPRPSEIRAGMARVAARLAGDAGRA